MCLPRVPWCWQENSRLGRSAFGKQIKVWHTAGIAEVAAFRLLQSPKIEMESCAEHSECITASDGPGSATLLSDKLGTQRSVG